MISVVVPAYNERESVPALGRELLAACAGLGREFEIIIVDDGSTDGTWPAVAALAGQDARVRGIRFRRNFGKAAALSAGFRAARGEIVVTLDGDLQDDPAEIARLLERLDEGKDVVSGWKRVRHDPWHKVWPSRVFNAVVSFMTGCKLHDHNCGLKAYRRAVVDEVEVYGELHRFIPVLAHARGFRVDEVVVAHRARRHGRSKYGASRLFKGFLDLLTVRFLTGYTQRPLHIIGGLGLVLLAVGLGGLAYLAVEWARGHQPIGQRPLLTYSAVALGVGVQLLCLGVLAELITAYHARSHANYSVAERIEGSTVFEGTSGRVADARHDLEHSNG